MVLFGGQHGIGRHDQLTLRGRSTEFRASRVCTNGASFISTMLWTIDLGARLSLQEQIAACVRRGLRDGELAPGERVPPAQELAEALDVDRNTVLAAYRQLRDAGVLEFRRGRGARIAEVTASRLELDTAAREFVALGRQHGYGTAELVKLIEGIA